MARRLLTQAELNEILEEVRLGRRKGGFRTTGQTGLQPGEAERGVRLSLEESLPTKQLKGLQQRRESRGLTGKAITEIEQLLTGRKARVRELQQLERGGAQLDPSSLAFLEQEVGQRTPVLGGFLGELNLGRGPAGVGLQFINQLLQPSQNQTTPDIDPGISRINQEMQEALEAGISSQVIDDFRQNSIRELAIQRLAEANQKITENNISEVVKQLTQQ